MRDSSTTGLQSSSSYPIPKAQPAQSAPRTLFSLYFSCVPQRLACSPQGFPFGLQKFSFCWCFFTSLPGDVPATCPVFYARHSAELLGPQQTARFPAQSSTALFKPISSVLLFELAIATAIQYKVLRPHTQYHSISVLYTALSRTLKAHRHSTPTHTVGRIPLSVRL